MIRGIAFALTLALLALPACGSDQNRVTGSVSVKSGERAEDVSTVNGGIHVEENATVRNVNSVNGSIELESSTSATSLDSINGGISVGENAKIADDISTVNGGVALGKETRVQGGVSAVNGAVALDNGTDVAGKVANVNGRIRLAAAHVGGGLKTETGDIDVGANARVEGGILVKKSRGVNLGKRALPRVVIGPGAVIEGPMKFEREVKLFVSESATIGPVEGAEIVKFSGEKPADGTAGGR
jgi:cytoskeletal protein CcmA (bactofilin family)